MHTYLCLCLRVKYALRTSSSLPNLDEQKCKQVGMESGSFC
jgi:hypothetical protein